MLPEGLTSLIVELRVGEALELSSETKDRSVRLELLEKSGQRVRLRISAPPGVACMRVARAPLDRTYAQPPKHGSLAPVS